MNHSVIPENFRKIPKQSWFSPHIGILCTPIAQTPDSDIVKLGLVLEKTDTEKPAESHSNVTMALLNKTMSQAASRATRTQCMTASITTSFWSGIEAADFICASAMVTKRGKNIVFVDGELHDTQGRLMASATGVWTDTGQSISGDDVLSP